MATAKKNNSAYTAAPAADKEKALATAIAQIERAYGKGSIMRMSDRPNIQVDAVPTGSLSLDLALGIGGLPRGRIIEIYGPESSGKTTLALHVVAQAQKMGGEVAYIDAEHAMDPTYAQALGVDINSMLISQPDTGEQGLEITEQLGALRRSGSGGSGLGGRSGAPCRDRGGDGRELRGASRPTDEPGAAEAGRLYL